MADRGGFQIPEGWVARGFRFVRFTTGAMRLEPDRRHLVLPVIGRLRSRENTRRLERLLAKGRARILSMTLSAQCGRLVVSVQAIVAQQPHTPREPEARCGIDLGIGREWAVIAHGDDTIQRVAHPAPWIQTKKERRRVARQLSRRIVGSRAWRHAKATRAALDRRAANLRAHQTHTLTTALARRYGTIVVEDLDVAAMGRGMGRRAFRRSVYQAGIGKIRPMLAYKCAQRGGVAAPAPFVGDHGGQAHASRGRARLQKTTLHVAGADDARTEPRLGGGIPSRDTSSRAAATAH